MSLMYFDHTNPDGSQVRVELHTRIPEAIAQRVIGQNVHFGKGVCWRALTESTPTIGNGSRIGDNVNISANTIGEKVVVGDGTHVDTRGGAIGNAVKIGKGCRIINKVPRRVSIGADTRIEDNVLVEVDAISGATHIGASSKVIFARGGVLASNSRVEENSKVVIPHDPPHPVRLVVGKNVDATFEVYLDRDVAGSNLWVTLNNGVHVHDGKGVISLPADIALPPGAHLDCSQGAFKLGSLDLIHVLAGATVVITADGKVRRFGEHSPELNTFLLLLQDQFNRKQDEIQMLKTVLGRGRKSLQEAFSTLADLEDRG